MRSIQTQMRFPLSSVKPLEGLLRYRQASLSAVRKALKEGGRRRTDSPITGSELEPFGEIEGLAYGRCPDSGSLFLIEVPAARAWARVLAEVSRYRNSPETFYEGLERSREDHVYAPKFLTGYEVLYVDDADGDRVSESEREKLWGAGIEITLDDAMPDVLLWNRETDALWVIEAVTSDGEVDHHKVDQIHAFAERNGKKTGGFTTAYPTWKVAAQRQGKHKNIAPGTYIWIREDAAKHFLAESFEF